MSLPTIKEVHRVFCEKHGIKYLSKNIHKDLSWNCYAVSIIFADMLKLKKIKARAVYGTWRGLCVSKKSNTYYRHGWVLINEREIIDPTRWVFENNVPYIFEGHVTTNKEYDEGMLEVRSLIPRPFPTLSESTKRIITFKWSEKCAILITAISGQSCETNQITSIDQAYWMANIPFTLWMDCLDEVYTNLTEESCETFIPLDFKAKWKATKEYENEN